ncbi:MAG: TetR/AcrR family transcriptional regulator [Bacteroidales bacterium]|nr:TetR/AcrR family transcriptional regulator [Bacteroidales bacterium]
MKDDTMEKKILESAKELFLQNGYEAVSTTQVAKKAGCNQALVHYYYRTKQKLFKIIFQEEIERMFMRLKEIPQDDISIEDFVSKVIDTQLEFMKENKNAPLFLIGELRNNPEILELLPENMSQYSKEILNRMRAFIKLKQSKGELQAIDVEDLLLDILSLNVFPIMTQSFFLKVWGMQPQEQDIFLERRKEHIKKVILASIKS